MCGIAGFFSPRVALPADEMPASVARMTATLALRGPDGQGKWLLRQLLYRHVPAHLVERPKTGFGVPIDAWLRGPLKDWAGDLLDPARLAREGFLKPEPINRVWREHLSGRRNHQHALWNALMFQAWLAAQ